jgi:uncharacterized membrane protein HdeD (DUF308 family)
MFSGVQAIAAFRSTDRVVAILGLTAIVLGLIRVADPFARVAALPIALDLIVVAGGIVSVVVARGQPPGTA